MVGYSNEWKKWGARDPYFAVLTDERFRTERLTDETRSLFFQTGHEFVESLLATIRATFDPGFTPGTILDFGCGVGRLSIPFAQTGAAVVAVDISPGMLEEGRRNAITFGAKGLSFLSSAEFLRQPSGSFDLANSFLTFQHIPDRSARPYLEAMVTAVKAGGVSSVQVLHTAHVTSWKRLAARLRGGVPGMNLLANLARSRSLATPFMHMCPTNLNWLFNLLQENDYDRVHATFTDHGGFRGIHIIAHRAVAPNWPMQPTSARISSLVFVVLSRVRAAAADWRRR